MIEQQPTATGTPSDATPSLLKKDPDGPGYIAYTGLIDLGSPEAAREEFEHRYEGAKLGERQISNEDGSTKTLVLYGIMVNTGDQMVSDDHMAMFLLTSAQAGYKHEVPPVVLSTPRVAKGDPQQPLSRVYFTLEKPENSTS